MEELVKRAQNGDEKAFIDLIVLIEDDLYKIAKSRLNEDDDVDDAIQETMMAAFSSIKRLKEPSYFKTWIIKILINKSNDIYRSKCKRKVIPFEEIKDDVAIEDDIIITSEQTLDFNFFCKNLKYEEKIIMVLYYLEKFNDKEIGQMIRMKENTVRTKRYRVLKRLRDNMKGGKIYE